MADKKTKVALGVAAGLIATGAAGYYFFASKKAKKNRKIAASWADSLKRDAEKKIKLLKSLDKTAVTEVIESVAAAYRGAGKVSKKDLSAAVSELKKNWQKLAKKK
jgi:hypothetical protein